MSNQGREAGSQDRSTGPTITITQPDTRDQPERTSPGQVDDPSLTQKLTAKVKAGIEDIKTNLSVAERLTRRAKKETVIIEFEDEIGKFGIEMRLPTAAEQDRMVELDKLMKAGDPSPELVEQATDEIYKTMSSLAIDPSLDYQFFKGGNFLGSDLGILIKSVMQADQDRIKQSANFRKK